MFLKSNALVVEEVDAEARLTMLRSRENLRVIAMGDSSVFGVGDYGDRLPAVGAGWSGRLAHDIGAEKFINIARNGARARHLTHHQLRAALAMEPDLALICIGTNDVLRGDFSPEEIKESLRTVVTSLNSLECLVVFLLLPDPIRNSPGPLSLRRILHRRVTIVNKILREFCREGLALSVETWHMPFKRELWHVDRMHPSPLGHQVIANHVRETIELPLKSESHLPLQEAGSKKFEIYWLMTNGLKWFAKRSVDLIPGLIWLVISDKFGSASKI